MEIIFIYILKMFFLIYIGYLLIHFIYFKSTLLMPKEYKIIKKLVNKIATYNNLGEKDIVFSIGAGSYMMYRAKELGLCKEEDALFFRNLNPFIKAKTFKNINIDELKKQAYVFGGIDAYAWRGVVWISKSSFRCYKSQVNFLAWVLAHEISHIIFNDHINQSKKLLKEYKNIKSSNKLKLKKLLEMKLSRNSEKKADKNSARMLINAGFSKSKILEEFSYEAETNGWEVETDPEGTHPGYIERYKALNKFVHKYKVDISIPINKNSWIWQYNRKNNTLTYFPKNK
tara:strand:+ start:981 stop:1838 length:858 start_codon:yes stop_codon:yes gene_type:complete